MRNTVCYTLIVLLSAPFLQAQDKDKPLQLLYFTASWCGPCQLMKQKTWPSPMVKESLEAYAFQTIDVDKQEDLARKWSVRSMPTYLILDPEGEMELFRMSGFMDAYRMSTWLEKMNAKARETLASIEAARQRAAENWAKIEPLTKDQISRETLKKGQQGLYILLQERGELEESNSKALDQQLRTIAKSHPEYIAEGILHPDLQVRAYIARALSEQEIRFNPWASENERKEAYAAFLESNKPANHN